MILLVLLKFNAMYYPTYILAIWMGKCFSNILAFFFQIGIWDFSLRVNWAISSIIDDLSSWRGHACLNFAVFVVLSKIFSNFPARLSCRMSDTLTPTFAKILWNVNRSLSLKSTEEISFVWSAKISFKFFSSVREHRTGKKLISFGHCPNYLSPPKKNLGKLYNFFWT